MSIASPQNRDEFKQHILMKLGAPVLQINVADEQLDIAINDAFQYYNERSHFYGTERMYLTFEVTNDFRRWWRSYRPAGDVTISNSADMKSDPQGMSSFVQTENDINIEKLYNKCQPNTCLHKLYLQHR